MTAPTAPRSGPLARNQYREGQILRASDLLRESDYFLARDRQHNALAHGPGILQGLTLVATETGSETPVTEQMLIDNGPRPIDLAVEAGVGIDWIGRLLIVPRKAPVGLQLATRPSPLDEGSYSLGLYFKRPVPPKDPDTLDACHALARNQLLEESYELRLARFDPNVPEPDLDPGTVYDGPTDDSVFPRPLLLGLVEWDGKAFVGYSTAVRRYAPVRAHIVRAPNDRAELELRDESEQFAVRFARMPAAGDPNPFVPGVMEDRLTLDEEGRLWVRQGASVGREGIDFRVSPDTTISSRWRAELETTEPGATFRKDLANPPKVLAGDAYAPGAKELRVVLQREAGANAGTGRNRVVVGLEDAAGEFQPALVVYDQPPVDAQHGFAVVEVCGDMYIRGTAFVHSVAKLPETGDTSEQLDLILQQLAGPLAGVFRAFLLSDTTWLQEFGTALAQRIGTLGSVRTEFVNALLADAGFANAVTAGAVAAAVPQAVNTAVPQAVAQAAAQAGPAALAFLQQPANARALVVALADALDEPGGGNALPGDTGARLLAALYRRLFRNHPTLRTQISNSATPGGEKTAIDNALSWLP